MELTEYQKTTAERIAQEMIKDGVADKYIKAHLEGDDKETGEFCTAYLMDDVRKLEKMQTRYMTNPKFRQDFQKLVFEIA